MASLPPAHDVGFTLELLEEGKITPQQAAQVLNIKPGSQTYEWLVKMAGGVTEEDSLKAMYAQQKEYENHAPGHP